LHTIPFTRLYFGASHQTMLACFLLWMPIQRAWSQEDVARGCWSRFSEEEAWLQP
jgi:hypothetical protein